MKTLPAFLLSVLSVLPAAGGPSAPADEPAGSATLVGSGGGRTKGRLVGDPVHGIRFLAERSKEPIRLVAGMNLHFSGTGPAQSLGLPPFRIDLGLGQRLSGQLASIDARDVTFLEAPGESRLIVARAGVGSVVQRPGESVVLEDGFETLDTTRWTVMGSPSLDRTAKAAGERSLRIPAGGTSLTHRLGDPVGSGRLEAALLDDGKNAAGQQWFVDLTFRGASGPETVRAVIGWAEESLAVESPGGPALAVQRLKRKPGWHRFSFRFGPDGTAVALDGDELAHGKGFDGPLIEIRLASFESSKAPEGLAGHVDDLRLVRFDEPVGGMEVDATQDEARLTGGDQLFGKFRSADAERVRIQIDGSDVTLPWSEVSGLFFRRESTPGVAVSGLLVRVEWRGAPGSDPRDLNKIEGALTAVTEASLTVATPYAGTLAVPLDRLRTCSVIGEGTRIVIDPTAHHLGDEVSVIPPLLDPPQPEGGILERTVDLASVPPGSAFLVLDVVQMVSESPEIKFSDLVRNHQLRTNVKLNGDGFDYVNHYIHSRNETPERVRLPIPKGSLRVGKNVIRFELTGTQENPKWLDDLGILGIALEFDPEAPAVK